MARAGKKGNGLTIEMYGTEALLQKIERAGGNIKEATKQCVDKSLNIVGNKMQEFMVGHQYTGDTFESYKVVLMDQTEYKIGKESYKVKDGTGGIVGYSVRVGGLPAIFLDVGTPKIKPYFFRYNTIEETRSEVERIQRETLEEILKELM